MWGARWGQGRGGMEDRNAATKGCEEERRERGVGARWKVGKEQRRMGKAGK